MKIETERRAIFEVDAQGGEWDKWNGNESCLLIDYSDGCFRCKHPENQDGPCSSDGCPLRECELVIRLLAAVGA